MRLRTRRNVILAATLIALAGCDDTTDPDGDDVGGGPDVSVSDDAGGEDAGGGDAGGGEDAGPGEDAGGEDAGAGDAGEDAEVDMGPPVRLLGGEVTGLTEGSLFVSLNGSETLEITADGAFTFATEFTDDEVWEVVNLGTRDEVGCAVMTPSGVIDAGSQAAVVIRCAEGLEHRPSDVEYDDAGEPEFYTRRQMSFDGDAYTFLTTTSMGAGADGVLYTSDDVDFYLDARVGDVRYDEEPLRTASISDMGPDGVPFTGDDVVDELTSIVLSPMGFNEGYYTYEDSGPDGLWYTDDDTISEGNVYVNTVDGSGALTCTQRFQLGDDGVPGTADDVLYRIEEFAHEADTRFGASVRRVSRYVADDTGADGVPCTDDDGGRRFRSSAWYDAQGRVTAQQGGVGNYTVTTWDDDGRLVRQENWGVGPNGVADGPSNTNPGSDDDPRAVRGYVYQVRGYTPDGPYFYTYNVTDAGADGAYYTADDLIEPFILYTYDAMGREANRNTIGPAGTLAEMQGPDGMLGTPDDRISLGRVTEYTADGAFRCMVQVRDLGANGTLDVTDCGNGSSAGGALDDEVINVRFVTYDAAGRIERFGVAPNPGDDGVWLTDDDGISVGNTPSGTVVYGAIDDAYLRIRISGRGADGVAFTADDELAPEGTFTNADGTVSGEVTGPGADGIYLTGDDEVVEYTVVEQNPAGGRARVTLYVGAGPDGAWFTADDQIGRVTTYRSLPGFTAFDSIGIAL
jgi:hypothetical protein